MGWSRSVAMFCHFDLDLEVLWGFLSLLGGDWPHVCHCPGPRSSVTYWSSIQRPVSSLVSAWKDINNLCCSPKNYKLLSTEDMSENCRSGSVGKMGGSALPTILRLLTISFQAKLKRIQNRLSAPSPPPKNILRSLCSSSWGIQKLLWLLFHAHKEHFSLESEAAQGQLRELEMKMGMKGSNAPLRGWATCSLKNRDFQGLAWKGVAGKAQVLGQEQIWSCSQFSTSLSN